MDTIDEQNSYISRAIRWLDAIGLEREAAKIQENWSFVNSADFTGDVRGYTKKVFDHAEYEVELAQQELGNLVDKTEVTR